MSLTSAYFFMKETDDGTRICHNCNGGVSFMATDDIAERTKYLITLAIEEGKRQKAKEIREALYAGAMK